MPRISLDFNISCNSPRGLDPRQPFPAAPYVGLVELQFYFILVVTRKGEENCVVLLSPHGKLLKMVGHKWMSRIRTLAREYLKLSLEWVKYHVCKKLDP